MRIGMIPNLVTLGVDALEELRGALGIHADDEECRRYLPIPEYVENLRRVGWIWSVVKGEGNQSLVSAAVAFEKVVRRITLIVLGRLSTVDAQQPSDPVRGRLDDAKDLATTV